MINKTCLICLKEYATFDKFGKYCTRECYYKMKRIRGDRVYWTAKMRKSLSRKYTGKGNPSYGKPAWDRGIKRFDFMGEKHPNWKGGFWISEDGYKVIQNEKETGGEKVLEHRRIMELHLGRKLLPTEIVHHINHDKLDNRIKNLMITTRSEHVKIHPAWKNMGI